MSQVSLSLLLPTRGRLSSVLRLFESIRQTVSNSADIEVVLFMDEDDHESRGLVWDRFHTSTIIGKPGTPMGRMTNACFEASHGRYVMLLNDDVQFRTPGWDRRVHEAFEKFPDGIALVYGNDQDQAATVPTFPILSRRCCQVLGKICPLSYRNLHIDAHLHDIFRRLRRRGYDRIVYLPDVIFEHLHHTIGKSLPDGTSQKRDPGYDDLLFISFESDRRFAAERLIQGIEAYRAAMVQPV